MPNISVKIKSLGKFLAAIRTSNTNLQKKIEAFLELAKEVKDESKFQKMPLYQKFKAQKIGHRTEIKGLIDGFNAEELEFSNECIYWCHKMFQERVCDKNEKYQTFYALAACYFRIESFAKTIEYGQKFLDLQGQNEDFHYFTLDSRCGLIHSIIESSRKLDRYEDAMKYLKEKLKLDVLRFNNGEISELNLLSMYYELLVVQIKTKNFKNALKTLKSLKLYSVNSMDTDDVIKAMEKRDYRKYFPLSLLYRDFDITEEPGKYSSLVMKHYSDFPRNLKEMVDSEELQKVLLNLAHIFLIKCEVLQNLGDKVNCEKWAYLQYLIHYDIQFHVRAMESFGSVENCGAVDSNSSLCDAIAAGLRLSIYDPIRRTKIFHDLLPAILGREASVADYLSITFQHYSLSIDHLVPFVQFCIKNFDDFKVHDQQCQTNSKQDMISYKNSLYIMKQFQTKLSRKKISECDQNEDIKFDVFRRSEYSVFW